MANLKSQGCTLSRFDSTASPNTYQEIGQVISIGGPSGTTGEIDVTNLSSTAKEFIPSLPDWGSVDCEVVFDQATTANRHQELWDDFSAHDWHLPDRVDRLTANDVHVFGVSVAVCAQHRSR